MSGAGLGAIGDLPGYTILLWSQCVNDKNTFSKMTVAKWIKPY